MSSAVYFNFILALMNLFENRGQAVRAELERLTLKQP
jgi:hypothetical protein